MRLAVPFVVLLIALGVVATLGGTPAPADLVVAIRGDVFTLDPQRMSYIKDFRMAHALYEGLLRWNNDDFTVMPGVAESLPDVSEDGRVYRFTVRADARWSNGDQVTAHDFVYAWRRGLLPDTAADYSNLFFAIDGAEAFFHWRREATAALSDEAGGFDEEARRQAAVALWRETESRFAATVGMIAHDERTLEVRLTRPVPYFQDLLCFPAFFPVHQPTVEGWPHGYDRDDPPPLDTRGRLRLSTRTGRLEQEHGWARPSTLVSNGPYRLASWRYRRDMRLVRSETFHDPLRAASDSVLAVTIEDTNTAVLAFASGRIDWLTDVNAEYQADMLAERRAYDTRHADAIAEGRKAGRGLDEILRALPPPRDGERRDLHAFPTFGTDFYSFNCRPTLADGRVNPFADRRVRRAFARCVDKDTIVENITRLHEPVMSTLIPPGSIPGYASPQGLDRDVDRARALLAETGWLDRDDDGLIEDAAGDPFPVVDLLYTTNSPRYVWISLELKAQWERELGIQIRLRGVETKFYKEDLKQGKFMIARGRWYGDYGDPTTFLNLFRSTDGNNDRGFSDERIDGLLAEADRELDPARRMTLLRECEHVLFTEELPMVPICQLLQIYMYDPARVQGLSRHPRLVQYLWRIERDGS